MGDMVMTVRDQPNVSTGVRTRSRACLECHRQFSPAREWHKYCSDACRAEWHRKMPGAFIPAQARLDFTPAASERAHSLRHRESKAERVLARLKEGPATSLNLLAVGGLRYGARIHELREAGNRIDREDFSHAGQEWSVYTLKKA